MLPRATRTEATLRNEWPFPDSDETWTVQGPDVEVNDFPADGATPLRSRDHFTVPGARFVFLCGEEIESQYHELICRMTIEDAVTGLYNKRYLWEVLDRSMLRARRNRYSMTLAILQLPGAQGGAVPEDGPISVGTTLPPPWTSKELRRVGE